MCISPNKVKESETDHFGRRRKRKTANKNDVKEEDQNTSRGEDGVKRKRGDIYMRLPSWCGSCYGDHTRASEHSWFGGNGRGWNGGGVCPASQSQPSAKLWHISHMQSPGVNEVTQRPPKKHRIPQLQNKGWNPPGGWLRLFVCKCVCVSQDGPRLVRQP